MQGRRNEQVSQRCRRREKTHGKGLSVARESSRGDTPDSVLRLLELLETLEETTAALCCSPRMS
jgi:hypothetical protein